MYIYHICIADRIDRQMDRQLDRLIDLDKDIYMCKAYISVYLYIKKGQCVLQFGGMKQNYF